MGREPPCRDRRWGVALAAGGESPAGRRAPRRRGLGRTSSNELRLRRRSAPPLLAARWRPQRWRTTSLGVHGGPSSLGVGGGGGRRSARARRRGLAICISAVGDDQTKDANVFTVEDANEGLHVPFCLLLLESVLLFVTNILLEIVLLMIIRWKTCTNFRSKLVLSSVHPLFY